MSNIYSVTLFCCVRSFSSGQRNLGEIKVTGISSLKSLLKAINAVAVKKILSRGRQICN